MQLSFYNEWHLGDCIFNLNYLNRLFQKNTLDRIDYYLKEDYIAQINEFNLYKTGIFLHPLQHKPEGAINLWIGHNQFVHNHPNGKIYDLMYVDFWNHISATNGLINPIQSREENLILLDEYSWTGACYDVLFVNSRPMSFQVSYDEKYYQAAVEYLISKSLTVCTTYPVKGATYCTMEGNYSVRDIAALSEKCRYVIGIHTGPFIPALNEKTLANVSNYIVLDSNNHFSYEKCLRTYSNQDFLNKVMEVI